MIDDGPGPHAPAASRAGNAKFLRAIGSHGCVLVGDPDYYTRLGFRHFPNLHMEGVPDVNVMAMPFLDAEPQGQVIHHPAFFATE